MDLPDADGYDSEENGNESIYQNDYDGMANHLYLYIFVKSFSRK